MNDSIEIVFGIIIFIIVWYLLNFIVKISSGFLTLERTYEKRTWPKGIVQDRGFAFGSYMSFGISDSGIYLKVNFPFSLSLKSVFIPFNEIETIHDSGEILGRKWLKFVKANVKVLFPDRIVDSIIKNKI